jgi:hypothetical protein
MHEVSSDGSVWKQASSFPELFLSPAIETGQTSREASALGGSSNGDVLEVESPQPSPTGRWHYAQNDVQKGPVTFDELKAIMASGNLNGLDLVWTDGMKEWVPAQTVAGLSSIANHAAGTGRGSSSSSKVDREVIRTLAESRPWAKFIAIAMFFVATLGLAFGPVAIVMGARWNQAGVIASGGFAMFYGGVFLWGSLLLLRYCGDISKLERDPLMRRLDVSLRSLRRFWIFLSIIWIVLLVNAIGAAIWAISIGVSLSGPWQ